MTSDSTLATASRRSLLAALPATALGTFLLDPSPAAGAEDESAAATMVNDLYPTQDPALVKEIVSVSHGRYDRARELVEKRPELANAAWDWGFGDWESALGAASHTGNRDIANLLLAHGARPDIFTAAMLGSLEVVTAFVSAMPGIQSQRGPHGITLLSHAKAGGDGAAEVAAYLEQLGDAHPTYANAPLSEEERQSLVGDYHFGSGPQERFEILFSRRGELMIQRKEGTPRHLFHQGNYEFHPSGAPSARIRFLFAEGRPKTLEIRQPDLVVAAHRAAAD